MRDRLAGGEDPPVQRWITANREKRAETVLSAITAGVLIIQEDGEVAPLTFIAPAIQATMELKYVAHFSNSLENAAPVYIAKTDIFGCVLGITSKAIAKDCGVIYDAHDLRIPYDTEEIGTATTVNEEEKEPTEGTGFKFPILPEEFTKEVRDDDDDEDIPVLVAIQKVMPFGYGDNPPEGNLNEENVKSDFQSLHGYGLLHATALEFLLKEYQGTSLHKTPNFEMKFVSKEFRDKVSPLLEEKVEARVRPINSNAQDHQLMAKQVHKAYESQIMEHIEKCPDLTALFAKSAISETPPGRGQRTTSETSQLIDAIKSHTTGDDGTGKDSGPNDYAKAFYSIISMYEVIDDDNNTSIELNKELNPYFLSILNKNGKAMNAVQLNQQLRAFVITLEDKGRMQDHYIDMPPLNKACLTQMSVAGWLSQTLTSEFAHDRTHLTCFNLAASNKRHESHQSAVTNMNENHMECELGVGKDARTKIDTKALANFDITTVEELYTLLANLNAFVKFLVAKRDSNGGNTYQPWLSQWLEGVLSELTAREGRKWLEEATRQTLYLPYAIALRVQNAFALVCKAAHDIHLNEAALEGRAPDSKNRIMRDIRLSFDQIMGDLASARISNTAGPFGGAPPLTLKEHCPTVMSMMYPTAPKGKRQQQDSPDGGKGGKVGRAEGKPQPPKPNAKAVAGPGGKKGFFRLANGAKEPNLRENKPPRVTVENGKQKFICMQFCTQGLNCTYTTKCNFGHVFDAKKLPKEEQEALKKYVTKEPAIEWVRGEEPRGVTFAAEGNNNPEPAGNGQEGEGNNGAETPTGTEET